MNLKNIFNRSNSIDQLKIGELQEEELRLKSRINRIRKEVDDIEKEKKKIFNSGVGADVLKKKMLVQELKQLEMTGKLKIKDFLMLHKRYMFISNLVIIKKYQRELQQSPIWNKIQSISPEKFETALIRVNLSGKGIDNVVEDLNRIIAMDIGDSDIDSDEAEKQMFDIWNNVENGSLDVSEAESLISIDKDIEKSLENNE